MAQDTLTEDGSTDWHRVVNTSVHIALLNDFGGGTASIEQKVTGIAAPLFNSGAAIEFTAADDGLFFVQPGDLIRITLAGSTNPVLRWSMAQVETVTERT